MIIFIAITISFVVGYVLGFARLLSDFKYCVKRGLMPFLDATGSLAWQRNNAKEKLNDNLKSY